MMEPALQHPVATPDGHQLLPAGAVLTEATLARLAASAPAALEPVPLLEFGTVRQDLLGFLVSPPYRAVFGGAGTIPDLLATMEGVHLAPPCLDCLVWFRECDPYTYRHSLTVLALTTLLARDLLPDSQDHVREAFAGPTHDIGKVCVPLEILQKETPLTLAERSRLEHHSLAGSVLLSHFLGDHRHLAVRVARDHHERKDGSGYPRGIRDIDPLVEIIIVSDVYDALLSPRPYRPISFDNRSAIDVLTSMAERGKIGWDVLKALLAHNRGVRFRADEIQVSSERRGHPPAGNMYGATLQDGRDQDESDGGDEGHGP
ncbi:MAG: HD domain-containing protein [Chromatiales bacterium]|jgi:HD-GYP domain-containing protein (c-di-GMP phosphodiesterase class II)